jgi:hypothetical protein
MSNQFGHLFRISTWGESHGGGVGVVVDGCPPRLALSEEDIQIDLNRRRPGQSEIVTPRAEEDRCQILSGVFEGLTLGTPIAVNVTNKDARPEAYREMESAYRPSHADYTYDAKFGIRNWQGGGRTSARETIGRVAAAAIGKKVLGSLCPKLEVVAYVSSIQHLHAKIDPETVRFADVESNIVRCPDAEMAARMIDHIKEVRSAGDSVGGVIECAVRGVPPGLGEPVFDRLEADLASTIVAYNAEEENLKKVIRFNRENVAAPNAKRIEAKEAERQREEAERRHAEKIAQKEKERLAAAAVERGLTNCLFFPPVPKAELGAITASLDCGLMVLKDVPAFYRGTSPNKFFDYIAAGIPVVNNYPGWLAGLITEHRCGIVVPPGNASAFADALQRLAADLAGRRSMGAAARALAEKEFARPILADRFIAALEAHAEA